MPRCCWIFWFGQGRYRQAVIRIRISLGALQDLNEGFLFYEAQDTRLGDYFVGSLRADIEGLRVTAGVHRVVYRDYHRLLSRVFPYCIFLLP